MSKEESILISLFVLAWVISWFLAIWILHLQLFLTGLFCISLAVLMHRKNV